MIEVGLAGWGDHDSLYVQGVKAKDKLAAYSRHHPLVEVDSSFYAIQPKERMAKYAEETPGEFGFIVKAYQEMTGHQRGRPYYKEPEEMYGAFRESLAPMMAAGKLRAALFQYPPWFDCTRENVSLLRETKRRMEGIPCALEFRHQSWFAPAYRERTLDFMREQGWIHSVCDEPQAGDGSVPIVLEATDAAYTIVRMHGRHAAGWSRSGGGRRDWREVRYLYRYSRAELEEWRDRLQALLRQTRRIGVIFNNNSGGDAADNAAEMMSLLGLRTPEGRDPLERAAETGQEAEQLDLFDL
ncbi:DUF72 domain-containing protein [Cohnella lubricantis]|uniref:DUF72 domain-containing protein n=1 Tax=Cohnella lubricantis TaxID=2163172 RepID=A0A841TK74_9BACL|nr:DUF72 domain-containing protein [Cohnella lubricantis]MBB6678891.1 DUF72 domain-containing protein [Cohnella lubricantis]MBP2120216.1 uncharacterized protein YecE (DUF72 family) [Cohnella lubricantis]